VQSVAKFLKGLDPGFLDRFRDLVGHPCGHRVFPDGVGKNVDEGGSDDFRQKVVCVPEVLIGLPGESDDDVDSEEDVLHLRADIGYLLCEKCRVVMPVHPFQNRIASALEGDVKVGEEFGAGGYPVNDVFCQQIRFNGGYAVAFDAFDGVQGLEQVEERFAGGFPEIAGVDTG